MATLRFVGTVLGLAIPVIAIVPPPVISAAASELAGQNVQSVRVQNPSKEFRPAEVLVPAPRPSSPAPRPSIEGPLAPPASGAGIFGAEVTRLAAEADAVDVMWQGFKAQCGVQMHDEYGFGREWFAIWDLKAEATVESASCRDMLKGVVLAGKNVRRDLMKARKAAQRATLDQGTEVGLLRWHGLDWSTTSE